MEENKNFTNSVIDHEYLSYLENKNIKVVSFDIFDTLCFRKCGVSENIFLEMAENKYLKKLFDISEDFKNYRVNCEKEAYRRSSLEEIKYKDIYANSSFSEKEKKFFQKLELKIEKKNLFINLHIYEWIKLAKKYNKKVILSSDMYLSLNQIKKIILNKIDDISLIDDIYISTEIGLRKSTGKLFEYVLIENLIKPDELLHIGDNRTSDINVASAMGIKTIFYNYNREFLSSLENERLYLKEYFIEKDYVRLLSFLSNPYINEEYKFFYRLGSCFLGPVLWEFSIWLNEIVKKQDIKQLNFLMREGFTFEKVYKSLFPDIKTTKMEISRESTNFLVLDLNDIGNLNFNKYRKLKIKDLYEIYFLEIKNENIKKIEDNELKSMDNIDFILDDLMLRIEEIKTNIICQEKALKKYLEELEINEKSIFLDFGGGATVINRLNKLLFKKNSSKFDLLFFSHSEGIKNTMPNRVFSFFPYSLKTINSIEKIRRTPDFVEILLNGYNFSSKGYEFTDSGINILKKELSYFDIDFKRKLDIFYEGVESFIKITRESYGLKSRYDREYLCNLIGRIIALPSISESNYLGKLEYDEGRGSSNIYSIVDFCKKEDNLENMYIEHINAPFKTQYEYPWIEGFITIKSPYLIKKFYGKMRTQNEIAIERILDEIDKKGLKEVSIYGAGEFFETLLPYLLERNIFIKNVIDSRAELKSFNFLGFEVNSLDRINLISKDILIIASVVFYEDIKNYILNRNSHVYIL